VKVAALLTLVGSTALANDAFLRAEVLDAVALPKPPASIADAAWQSVPARTVTLTPQRSVHLHDKKANAVLAQPAPLALEVRAVSSPEGLTLRLEWADPAREGVREDEANVFADSIALEVPERFGPGLRLPAISMGDEGATVKVTMLRAAAKGALESRLVAAGFGSSTRLGPPAPSDALVWDEGSKRWRAVLKVAAADVKGQTLIPVAFAAWDGRRHERSGHKPLPAWKFVRRPGRALHPKHVGGLAGGYGPEQGDAARGRALAEGVCVACHHLPGRAFAPVGLAPSLEAIGAIASPGYLRDSIVEPSLVVLHEPNPNQHYDRNAPRDANGAAPNSDAYRWSTLGADGKRTSKMPPFAAFTKEQVADLVAFLRSLDGTSKESP